MSVFGHLIARLVFQVDVIMILHHWIEFTLLKVKHTPWPPVHTYVIWILNEFYDFLFWYSSSWILYAMKNTFWALPFLYAVFGCALQIRCLPQNHFHYLLTNFQFTSLWVFFFFCLTKRGSEKSITLPLSTFFFYCGTASEWEPWQQLCQSHTGGPTGSTDHLFRFNFH